MPPETFLYNFTPRARQSIADAQTYLAQFGGDAPLRFTNALQTAVNAVCETAGTMRQPADEVGSVAFSLPVYLRLFTTAKVRKRNSNAGVWRLYYTLQDTSGDGQADTVLILLVSHAAAKPLTSWLDEGNEPDNKPSEP